MPLKIQISENRAFSRTVHLDGRLDNDTVGALDLALDWLPASKVDVVVFDLEGLEYISSAGLRTIFRVQKLMAERSGKALLVNPTPQVRKVLEIVKAVDLAAVFASNEELDAYLDVIQRRIMDGE